LHLNQGQFREWYIEDQFKAKLAAERPLTPMKVIMKTPSRLVSGGQTATPPNRSSTARAALGEINGNDVNNSSNVSTIQDENLPVPTPGQPRKYARMDSRHHPYARSTSGGLGLAGSEEKPDAEVVTVKAHRQSGSGNESEEEFILQRLAHRRSQSKSPNGKGKGRSVSYTTTTTTTTKSYDIGDAVGIYEDSDCAVENTNLIWDELAREQENLKLSQSQTTRPKTPKTNSGSGAGAMSVSKIRNMRESPRRSGGEDKTKVRKTSGRVGSASQAPVPVKR